MNSGIAVGSCVAFVAFLVYAVVSLPFQNEMAVMECKAMFQVPLADIELIKDRKLPQSHNGKCMMACVLKKMKVMTKKGEFDLRSVQKWLRNKYQGDRANLVQGKAVAEACARHLPSLNVKDECDMAAEILTCFKTQDKLYKKKNNGGASNGQI